MFAPISQDPWAKSKFQSNDIRTKRDAAIRSLVGKLAGKAGFTAEKCIEVGYSPSLLDVSPASKEKNRIELPLIFLIDFKDLLPEFKSVHSLKEFDELIEKNPTIIQLLADKLADHFERDRIKVGREEVENLRLVARFLYEKPELAIHGIRFTILHEIAHLQYKHTTSNFYPKHQKKWMAIGATVGIVLAFIVAIAISATLFGFLITIPIALLVGLVAAKCIQKIRNINYFKKTELEADNFAKNALKGNEDLRKGGIYLFETLCKHQIELRNKKNIPVKEKILYRVLFSPKGNYRVFYFSHPKETTRIQNLKK